MMPDRMTWLPTTSSPPPIVMTPPQRDARRFGLKLPPTSHDTLYPDLFVPRTAILRRTRPFTSFQLGDKRASKHRRKGGKRREKKKRREKCSRGIRGAPRVLIRSVWADSEFSFLFFPQGSWAAGGVLGVRGSLVFYCPSSSTLQHRLLRRTTVSPRDLDLCSHSEVYQSPH